MAGTVDYFRITPDGTPLETLSPYEIKRLILETRENSPLFLERSVLATLYSGHATDDVKTMLDKYKDFRLDVARTARGIEIELHNAPEEAFVAYKSEEGGKVEKKYRIIEGIRQNVFAVMRDLVFIQGEIERTERFDLKTSKGITDSVFLILRNTRIYDRLRRHKALVCWGGHAISEEEYDYAKEIGYQAGLRSLDIITGCGSGAMKGPMKGAAIAHAKQRIKNGNYIGITEPGIIASEAPNAIVDPLIIMPDIEKRLEDTGDTVPREKQGHTVPAYTYRREIERGVLQKA